MEIGKPVGIDLGTTNSCVGIMNTTDSDIILHKDKMGVSTTPSCVWYNVKTNEIVVGKRAFRRRGSRPEPAISIKRKMGTTELTVLGQRRQIPSNLPAGLRRVLLESRQERLERFLSAIDDPDPERRAKKRDNERRDPPRFWVLDQETRLETYLESIEDEQTRRTLWQDPPLLWLPEEVSAMILSEEARQMQGTLDEIEHEHHYCVDRAIVTIPAYFEGRQIEATREAGRLAGLKVIELLQEPTAAATYYCWRFNLQDGCFMIFDLGGGTFDVSIIRRTVGQTEVLGISGNNRLGGDDMDRALARWLQEKVTEEDEDYELDLDPKNLEDQCLFNRLVLMAEGIKKSLTTEGETLVRDTTTVKDRSGQAVCFDMVIERQTFEDLIHDLVRQCLPKCYEALARAKKRAADVSLASIDQVFLAGGSTHIPLVQREIIRYLCRTEDTALLSQEEIEDIISEIRGDTEDETTELCQLARDMLETNERALCERPLADHPDLCVVMGAAIRAASYGSETRDQGTSAQIEFVGPRGTRRTQIPIKGRVTVEQDVGQQALTVLLTGITLPEGMDAPLGNDGAFLFKRVPLHERTHNPFRVQVISKAGEVLATAPIVIEQNPEYSEISVTGSDTTLARAYYIDVQEQGRVARRILLQSGTSLPCESKHLLAIPDPNIGALDFRIYEGRRHLKTIAAVIDETLPPRTPIDFSIGVKQDHLIICEYRVGKNGVWESAIIEPPGPEAVPSPEQVEALCHTIEETLNYMPRVAAQKYRNRLARLCRELAQARAASDAPKLIDLFGELEGLRDDVMHRPTDLKPLWGQYEQLLTKCRGLLRELAQKKPDYPVDEALKTLGRQRDDAKAAYDMKDQQLYGERWEMLKGTHHALQEEVVREDDGPGPGPGQRCRQRMRDLIGACRALAEWAENMAAQFDARASNPPEGETQEIHQRHRQQCNRCHDKAVGCMKTLETLDGQCACDPDHALMEADTIAMELEKVRVLLQAKHGLLTGRRDDGSEKLPIWVRQH